MWCEVLYGIIFTYSRVIVCVEIDKSGEASDNVEISLPRGQSIISIQAKEYQLHALHYSTFWLQSAFYFPKSMATLALL